MKRRRIRTPQGDRSLRRSLILPLLALVLLATPLGAQGELPWLALAWERAAAATASREQGAAVATCANGTTIVAWSAPVGSSLGVHFRLYDLAGQTIRSQTTAALLTGQALGLDVACDAAGNFALAWARDGVQLLAFTAAGERRPELDLTTSGTSPSLAIAPQGQLALAWNDYISPTNQLQLRRIDPGGGEPWTRTVDQSQSRAFAPDVTIDGAGNPAVVYSYTADGDFVEQRIRRYSGAGALSWGYDEIDGETATRESQPAVAADPSGDLLVVWESDIAEPGEFVPLELVPRFRRYSAAGVALDTGVPPVLSPNDEPLSLPIDQRVAAVEEDLFAVSWLSGDGLQLVRVRLGGGPEPFSRFVTAEAGSSGLSGAEGAIAVAWDDELFDGPIAVGEAAAQPAQAPQGVYARLYVPSNSYTLGTNTAGTNEGSGQPVVFTIARGNTGGGSSVGYRLGGTAVFGKDYTLVAPPTGVMTATGRLRFAPGEEFQRLELAIVDDALGEPTKTIALTLTSLFGADELSFPVALVTLGDNDLAEVRVAQSGGSTVLRRGDPPDVVTVALRTVPETGVTVVLTPSDRRINLGNGFGAPLRLVFRPDESAKTPQRVEVATVPAEEGAASLAANASIGLESRSGDPGYDVGARFTVDGRDTGSIPVELVLRPGENPNPQVPSVYLPIVVR